MKRVDLIKKLVRRANVLDTKGRTAEADELTKIASRLIKSQVGGDLGKLDQISKFLPKGVKIHCGKCGEDATFDPNCLESNIKDPITGGFTKCTFDEIMAGKCSGWVDTTFNGQKGKVSPDGCWFIYSTKSGFPPKVTRHIVFTGKAGCDCTKCCKAPTGIGGGGGL